MLIIPVYVGIMNKPDGDELPSSSKWVNDNFILGDLLGSGTFGKVYTVQCRKNKALFALKEINQSSLPKYIAQEIKVMAKYGGRCNIMRLIAAFRDKGRVFVIMEHFPHENFKDVLPFMTIDEKVSYFKNLLIALNYLHANRIIHRDVKPANFLYNRRNRKYSLIDFGLSQEYVPTSETVELQRQRSVLYSRNINGTPVKPYRLGCGCDDSYVCEICKRRPAKHVNKAGTPGFRPPEILLRFDQSSQSSAIDIWSAGVVLLSLLFRRHPIFRPADDFEAITQICAIVGTQTVVDAATKGGVTVRLPMYPGVNYSKMADVVRFGFHGLPRPSKQSECKVCEHIFYANSKCRCFCVNSESPIKRCLRLYTPKDDESLLVLLLKRCLDPDPYSRPTATTLLLCMEEYEDSETIQV